MSALLYLRLESAGDYVHGGEHFTPAGASDLIKPYRWAAVSRSDGSLVAGDSRDQVAAYGTPRFGPDLAQETWEPDWYHTACGEGGTGDGSCGCEED